MPLTYSCVARGSSILAEYAEKEGNFRSVAGDLLEKFAGKDGKFTHSTDGFVFTLLIKDGYTYAVVSDESLGRVIPSAYLDKLQEKFVMQFSERGRSAPAGSLTKSFAPQMQTLMNHVATNPENYSKVHSVAKKVEEVKTIMAENIDKALQRGEKLELLNDKTEHLAFEADRFMTSGRTLRRTMWWQNFKVKLIIGLVVVLLAVVIFLVVYFSGGKKS